MLLGTVGTQAQGQTLYKHPLYNAVTDFTPVALIAEVPIVLIARKDLPAKNLKEFVAYAKANQAKMQFGSAGAGSATHLGCVVAQHRDGHEHHARALQGHRPGDAGSGRPAASISCARSSPPPSRRSTAAASRRSRIMTKDRSPVLPNLPTTREQGLDVAGLYLECLYMPKGTPADVVKKLNDAAVAAMNTPAIKDRLQKPRRHASWRRIAARPEYLG